MKRSFSVLVVTLLPLKSSKNRRAEDDKPNQPQSAPRSAVLRGTRSKRLISKKVAKVIKFNVYSTSPEALV